MDSVSSQIVELVRQAPQDAQKVIAKTYQIEKEKLYMGNPPGVPDEIVRYVKDALR